MSRILHTPLYSTAVNENSAVVEVLIEAGADLSARSKKV